MDHAGVLMIGRVCVSGCCGVARPVSGPVIPGEHEPTVPIGSQHPSTRWLQLQISVSLAAVECTETEYVSALRYRGVCMSSIGGNVLSPPRGSLASNHQLINQGVRIRLVGEWGVPARKRLSGNPIAFQVPSVAFYILAWQRSRGLCCEGEASGWRHGGRARDGRVTPRRG